MPSKVSVPTITVRVLLFSLLKEKIGRSEIDMNLDSGMTGNQFLDLFSTRYPVIDSIRPTIRLAVNESYVNGNHVLLHGDEIALITPVSGG